MKIMVLGGAGKMGCIAVQFLAQDERVEKVVIGDIDMENAKTVANYLDNSKVEIKEVDIKDADGFVSALKEVDVCLNATVYYTNLDVMEACLKAGAHYTDMGGLFHTTRKQLALDEAYKEAGISAVLGMGSAPGVPNIQARYAADRLETIESIKIYDGIKTPPADDVRFTYAVPTILDELTLAPMVFRDGEFRACEPLSEFEDYWFTEPLGLLPMHLSLHSEVATLPVSFQDKGVRKVFFKINYWGMAKETVEKVKVLADFGFNDAEPLEVKGVRVSPKDVMVAKLGDFVPPISEFLAPAKNEPPDWVKEIVTEVKGKKDGKVVTYRLGTLTVKGALPTGVAPAIAAIWMGEGKIEAGVYPPETSIAPEAFFKEMERVGIYTQVTTTKML